MTSIVINLPRRGHDIARPEWELGDRCLALIAPETQSSTRGRPLLFLEDESRCSDQ
jgi:hypothetical protein